MINKVRALTNPSSFKGRVANGVLWTLSGFGAQKVLQLASNLILTRLLFPEAFGLMALVTVFLVGLQMLSDIGVRPSIIQSANADSPDFLNTAWTLQIIRGFTLWIILSVLAVPISLLYQEPELSKLLLFVGLSAILQGFQSIEIPLANRRMQFARITLVKIGGQIIGIIAMVALAIQMQSVWALAIGTVIGATMGTILGHVAFRTHKHRLRLHKDSFIKIFHFGKWIFWSTLFAYLGGKGIRAVEGFLVSTEMLGMIAIAGTMAWAAIEIVEQIIRQVLFPALSSINRDNPARFSSIIANVRLKLLFITTPIFALLSLSSNLIIDFLYDDRYRFAGPALAILAAVGAANSLQSLYQNALLALGDSKTTFKLNCVTTVFRLTGVYFGFQLGGVLGMLTGVGVGSVLAYFTMVYMLRGRQITQFRIDLLSIVAILTVAFLTYHINIAQWV